MDRYGFDVHLTPAARRLLKPDEALVLDWYRMAICCAGTGEMSLYPMKEKAKGRRGLVRLKGGPPIYAARAIFPHLAGRLRPARRDGAPTGARENSPLGFSRRGP